MDSNKNSANFELCFIFFYEHYAWVTTGVADQQPYRVAKCNNLANFYPNSNFDNAGIVLNGFWS